MENLTFQNLFKLVLNETGLKASTFSRELHRERSLMYKWLSGSSNPPAYYFPLITKIVIEQSTKPRQLLLMKSLRKFVADAHLPLEIQESLLGTDSVETLLVGCMDISVTRTLRQAEHFTAYRRVGIHWTILLWSIFAAISGGLLWNLVNRILGWQYFMGNSGDILKGLPAFVWGFITNSMIPLPLIFLHRDRKDGRQVPIIIVFSLVGGLSALLFFSSGISGTIEALHIGSGLKETILVILFALCNSLPVYIAATWIKNPSFSFLRALRLVFIPTGVTVSAFLLIFIIDLPQVEILQLRGFIVGFVLRISLFYIMYYFFEDNLKPL